MLCFQTAQTSVWRPSAGRPISRQYVEAEQHSLDWWRWSFSIQHRKFLFTVNLFWKAALPVGDQSAAFIIRQLSGNHTSTFWRPDVFWQKLHSPQPGCHDNSAHCWELIGCEADWSMWNHPVEHDGKSLLLQIWEMFRCIKPQQSNMGDRGWSLAEEKHSFYHFKIFKSEYLI